MNRQIVRADPAHRRLAIWIVLGAAVLGTLGLAATLAYLGQVTSPDTMIMWLWGTAVLAMFGGLSLGGYLIRMGYQVLRAEQFPLPGQRVVRDTPVRQGPQARQIAWLAMGSGVVVSAASSALPVLLWGLLRTLGD